MFDDLLIEESRIKLWRFAKNWISLNEIDFEKMWKLENLLLLLLLIFFLILLSCNDEEYTRCIHVENKFEY